MSESSSAKCSDDLLQSPSDSAPVTGVDSAECSTVGNGFASRGACFRRAFEVSFTVFLFFRGGFCVVLDSSEETKACGGAFAGMTTAGDFLFFPLLGLACDEEARMRLEA